MRKSLLIVCVLAGLSLSSYSQVLYGDYQVVVEVEGNGYAHSTQVYFDDESWDPQNPPTYGWDACCDALLVLGNAFQPHVFTEVVAPPLPANNSRLSLNALPHLFEETEVPLGFLPGELAQFTFTFNELSSLPPGVTVELEDIPQNITQDLLVNNSYTTWSSPNDDEIRFILRFNPSSVTSIEQNHVESADPLVFVDGEDLVVFTSQEDAVKSFSLYDLQGRLIVFEDKKARSAEYRVAGRKGFGKGLFIVKVELENGDLVSQKMWFE